MRKTRRYLTVAVDFFGGIGERNIWTFAAASTFYLFLSLVPILGLVCSLLPYTPLTEGYLLDVLKRFAPEELYTLLSSIITSIYAANATTLSITAVASIWTASLSMQSLMRGMDSAYDVERKENALLFRLRACLFMVVALAAIVMSLCGLVYGEQIVDLIEANIESTWAEKLVLGTIRAVRYPVMMLLLFGVFLVFYRWMPAGQRRLLGQWPGALFSTVAWLVFSYAFGLYVSYSDRYGIYGVLGTIIVALLWMYYCMFILLVGAFINRFIAIEPERLKG